MDVDIYVRYYCLPFYTKKSITIYKNYLILNNLYYSTCNILKINDYLYQFHFQNITLRFITNLDMQITLRVMNPTAIEQKLSCLL